MKIPMKVSKRTIGDPYELCLLKMFQNYQERGKRDMYLSVVFVISE